MYGLYGLNHHIVEKSGDVTDVGQTNKQQAKIGLLSILICEKLSLAIWESASASVFKVRLVWRDGMLATSPVSPLDILSLKRQSLLLQIRHLRYSTPLDRSYHPARSNATLC